MNLYTAFKTFLAYLCLGREKILYCRLEQVTKSEKINDFLIVESSKPGVIEYSTIYGFRVLYQDRPELNEFIVAKKGNGFAKARNMPYIYLQTLCEPSQLIVESPCVQVTTAGYAQAVKLPYAKPVTGRACAIASTGDEYPEGALVVRITEDSKESTSFSYANAVPLPLDRNSIYIEKLNILDTEYATLIDFQRF